MRKILLGTTACIGAALLTTTAFAQAPVTVAPASPAQLAPGTPVSTPVIAPPTPALSGAGGLSVRLGGFFEFSGGLVQDNWDYARSRNESTTPVANNRNARQRQDLRNDLELNVFIDGRASNGMTYGAVFEFQMDNNVIGGSGTGVDMDEAYGYISFPNVGTLRFGQEDNAASLLQVRPPGSQSLGGDGDWWRYISNIGLPGSSNMYLLSGVNDGHDATKIIYLSPQFAGFDFGLSYAANQGEGRRTDFTTTANTTQSQRDRTTNENEWAASVRYRGTMGAVGIALGAGAMGASAPVLSAAGVPLSPRGQDILAYNVGASIQAYGFALGGEFVWGQYNGTVGRNALNAGLDDSYHYMVGATYTIGPVVFGAIFGQAFQDNGVNVTRAANGVVTAVNTLEDRNHTLWGVGAGYNLAPGLVLYAYYNHIEDENVANVTPSNGLYGGGPGNSGTTLAQFSGSNTRTINVGAVGIRLAF